MRDASFHDPGRSDAGARNRLLAALGAMEYTALAPELERVELETRELLFDVDQPIEHVYFPEGMVGSIVGVMADGSAVETATVGLEGMVGLPVFLGTDRMSAQAFAQVAGPALRMRAGAFRHAVARSPALMRILHRYTQALFTFVAQGAACNRRHLLAERCARWLLHTHDRVVRDEFPLTHRFLSQMLGVRRATVTEAMGAMEASGAITYESGRVRVVDRSRLAAATCECYAIIVREFDRLLDGASAPPSGAASPLSGLTTSTDGRTLVGDGAPHGEPDEEPTSEP